jgi:hypothetical protein
VLRRLIRAFDLTSRRQSTALYARAAKALNVRRRDVRAAFPADALGGVLVVYFRPPTAASEVWCIRVDIKDLRAIGDPIRFTQEWAWIRHAQESGWWQEWTTQSSPPGSGQAPP